MSNNYLELARQAFPNATAILGHGRYAVANGNVVYLATTEQQQRSIALGIVRSLQLI